MLGEGAHAVVTTPSATRVYRTAGEPAVQTVRLRLGPGSIMEWVPDHTIPFAGSALRQSFDVEVGDGARLILVDAFAAGRVARGEAWRFALLDSALTVRDTRGCCSTTASCSAAAATGTGSGGAEGRPYFATIVLVADTGLDALIADLPGALPDRAAAVMGVARLPRRGAWSVAWPATRRRCRRPCTPCGPWPAPGCWVCRP